MAFDLILELEGLVDALDEVGAQYAICGGLALGLHGFPRATMDIDLLVPSEQLEVALSVARERGFDVPARKMVFGLQTNNQREVHRVSKLDAETSALLVLNLLIVNSELEGVWRDRASFDVGGRTLSVVSRDGLATMKRIAGRPQDLVDVAKLEGGSDDDESE